jgi:hypothetical protein
MAHPRLVSGKFVRCDVPSIAKDGLSDLFVLIDQHVHGDIQTLEDEFLRIAQHLVYATRELANADIVHLDIKAENVVFALPEDIEGEPCPIGPISSDSSRPLFGRFAVLIDFLPSCAPGTYKRRGGFSVSLDKWFSDLSIHPTHLISHDAPDFVATSAHDLVGLCCTLIFIATSASSFDIGEAKFEGTRLFIKTQLQAFGYFGKTTAFVKGMREAFVHDKKALSPVTAWHRIMVKDETFEKILDEAAALHAKSTVLMNGTLDEQQAGAVLILNSLWDRMQYI